MPEGGGTLINFGELSRPATVLIEKISDAIGGIAKPWQIKRIARAELAAEIMRVDAKLQISEIERRGLERLIVEEGVKQKNIEEITAKTIPLIRDDARPEEIAEDWLSFFFEHSRRVSDSEMQSVWSRILAGEAHNPGRFSRKTVELVGSLDKQDAQKFTNLCSFCWNIDGDLVPLVLDKKIAFVDPPRGLYGSINVDFNTLVHLDSVGLIRFEADGFNKQPNKRAVKASYFGKDVTLVLNPIQWFLSRSGVPILSGIDTGIALFTQAGSELAPISGATAIEDFFEYARRHWRKRGVKSKLEKR